MTTTTPFVPIFSLSIFFFFFFPGGEVNIEKNVFPAEFTTAKPWRGLGKVKIGREERKVKREIVIFGFSPHNAGTMTRPPRERSIVVGKPDAPFASRGGKKLKRKDEKEEETQKARGKTSNPFRETEACSKYSKILIKKIPLLETFERLSLHLSSLSPFHASLSFFSCDVTRPATFFTFGKI